jgi:branched-chain amino acid transport system permease protein
VSITNTKKTARQQALLWTPIISALLLLVVLMGFETFFRTLLLGLPQGAMIALIAVGYSMVYGIILLINFAHGEIFMLSAYLVLMFLWSPSDFPVRVPGAPLFVPITVAILLSASSFVTFNTVGASTSSLRKPSLRWPLGIVAGGVVGWMAYRAFLGDAWLGALAALALCVFVGFVTYILTNKLLNSASQTARLSITGVFVFLAFLIPFFWLRSQPFTAAVIASCFLTATIGVTLDTVAYKPLRTAPRLIPLITAIGMSIFFQSLAQTIWGAEPFTLPDETLPELFQPPQFMTEDGEFITTQWLAEKSLGEQISIGHCVILTSIPFFEFNEPIRLPIIDLLILGLGLFVFIGLNLLIYKTRLGKSMRACQEDKTTARLVGVNVDTVVASTFIIGSALAALVSPLWVLKYAAIEPTMGLIVGILAFASAVLGGIGDVKGAMFGGMAIGIIYNFVPAFENLDTWAIVTYWGWMSEDTAFDIYDKYLVGLTQWRLGVAYAFMIMVIIFKPTGLFGETTAKRA